MTRTAPPHLFTPPPAKRASGEEGRLRYAPTPLLTRNITLLPLMDPFYSAPVVYFYSALDRRRMQPT